MFSSSELLNIWLIYLAACLGLFFVWWRITRHIKYPLVRLFLRVLSAACMLIPFQIAQGSSYMAPAIVMAMLEMLFVPDAGFSRAGIPLLLGVATVLIVFFGGYLGWQKYWIKRQQQRRLQQVVETEQLADADALEAESREMSDAHNA